MSLIFLFKLHLLTCANITGNVQPYKFILPSSWKQVRVANILSGNYCQPKCAEPWVEVKFENVNEGSVQVVASPMVRLSNKPHATIEEIGPPEKIISALGQFVTGNSYDPDELLETTVDKKDDLTVSAPLHELQSSFRIKFYHEPSFRFVYRWMRIRVHSIIVQTWCKLPSFLRASPFLCKRWSSFNIVN